MYIFISKKIWTILFLCWPAFITAHVYPDPLGGDLTQETAAAAKSGQAVGWVVLSCEDETLVSCLVPLVPSAPRNYFIPACLSNSPKCWLSSYSMQSAVVGTEARFEPNRCPGPPEAHSLVAGYRWHKNYSRRKPWQGVNASDWRLWNPSGPWPWFVGLLAQDEEFAGMYWKGEMGTGALFHW